MGWNDHVEFVDKQCQDCGETDTWEIWNEVALARYSGGLGKALGHDEANHNRCPYCRSANGEYVEDDEWYPE